MSILERRQIAILLPELSEKLEIDHPNVRTVRLSIDDAKRVFETMMVDTRKHRAMVQSALDRATACIANAIADATGIGSIPVNIRLYQFKITLSESMPTIWRRVQIKNCTLEKLHEHIQLAIEPVRLKMLVEWMDTMNILKLSAILITSNTMR